MISRDLWNPPTYSYIASRQCEKKETNNKTSQKQNASLKLNLRLDF